MRKIFALLLICLSMGISSKTLSAVKVSKAPQCVTFLVDASSKSSSAEITQKILEQMTPDNPEWHNWMSRQRGLVNPATVENQIYFSDAYMALRGWIKARQLGFSKYEDFRTALNFMHSLAAQSYTRNEPGLGVTGPFLGD